MADQDGYALGVDLGTSNTVAVLRWPDGRTRPLLFDGQPVMPSGVFLDETGRFHVGRDAQRLAQADPARFDPNPKRRIDEAGALLGDREVATVDLLGALLGAVARAAVEAVGFLPPAVVTYPAAWGARRREVLATAVGRAGWPPVDPATVASGEIRRGSGTILVPEPVAAVRYFADVLRRPVPVGKAIAVFDFGGGTLDIAVVRNEGADGGGRARFAVVGSGGVAELGGLDLDSALVDHLGQLLATADPQAWRQLAQPATPAQWRNRRQFWDDVRGAKEMLSRSTVAPVPVPGVDQAVHLTRDELERLATPLLRRGVMEAGNVITNCRMTSHELAGLFLVGGSSRVPLVARLLHSELGIAPTVLEQPELPVAEGALAELVAPPPSPATTAGPVGLVGSDDLAAAGPAAGLAAAGPMSAGPMSAGPAGAGPGLPGAGATVSGAPSAGSGSGNAGPGGAASGGAGAGPGGAVGDGPAGVPSPGGPPVISAPPYQSGTTYQAGTYVSGAAGSPAAPPVSPGPAYGSGAASAPPYRSGVPSAPPYRSGVTSGPPYQSGGPAGAATDRAGWHPAPAAYPVSPAGRAAPQPATPVSGGQPGSRYAAPPPRPAEPDREPVGIHGGGHHRRSWWVGGGAAVALVAVVVAGYLYFTGNRYADIDFKNFADVGTIEAGENRPSSLFTRVVGDRAYAAYQLEDNRLEIVAVDITTANVVWRKQTAETSDRWAGISALPDGVIAYADQVSVSEPRAMVVYDDDGDKLWTHQVRGDDWVHVFDGAAVVIDRTGNRVVGLDRRTGTQKWSHNNPSDQYGNAATAVYPVSTAKDISGPVTVTGDALAPDLGDDQRIVQIGADRSVRLIDVKSGKIIRSRPNVADPDDTVLAYEGRLFVGANESGYRIARYDLESLGEPSIVYTATDAQGRLDAMVPCGDGRICLLETSSLDRKTTHLVAVNAEKGGEIWRKPSANAQLMVPVGDHVITRTQSTPESKVFDADGDEVVSRSGVAVRLDAANVLIFDEDLSTYSASPSVAGLAVRAGEPVELGRLRDVWPASCSWNTAQIICGTDEGFVVRRFAGE
ncbi:Hsp70 family protein [Polymorphospora rubra]|uniref:Hsp70 family protein n=1 Tax=Polymorphospora rubra TaxID=338584 RepID=UPI0034032227